MAESLRRLNQIQDVRTSSAASPIREQQQPGTPQDDQKSEIYHSLEDAIPIAGASASPAPTASSALPLPSPGGSNAPIIGQVCRYVIDFPHVLLTRQPFSLWRPSSRMGYTDAPKQLQNYPDTAVAAIANRRDRLQCLWTLH